MPSASAAGRFGQVFFANHLVQFRLDDFPVDTGGDGASITWQLGAYSSGSGVMADFYGTMKIDAGLPFALASGDDIVPLPADATYQLGEQGSVVTVLCFDDGFESGDTDRWSTAVPQGRVFLSPLPLLETFSLYLPHGIPDEPRFLIEHLTSSRIVHRQLSISDALRGSFAPLNRVRRAQAAALVVTGPPWHWGMLMNWGGRSGSDSIILTVQEAYLTVAGGYRVLLVDDDWDFDDTVTNDGGRPFYETALSAAGYSFDVWETESAGAPSAGDLAPYEAVVWFTGYDWQDPITAAEESALTAYLDGGGRLILSSMELAYADQGATLRADYLGVDSVTQDVGVTDVAGNPSDPWFAELGAYRLARPDDWAAYWPDGSYEGPYNDAVVAGAGALEPLICGSSGQASATRFDGGGFRTVYLGFPLEWVNTVQERAQILGTALDWMCNEILTDGFESGDTSAWSNAVP